MDNLNAAAHSLHLAIHSNDWRSPELRQTHFVPGSVRASRAASHAVWKLLPVCLACTPILKRDGSLIQRSWKGSRRSRGEIGQVLFDCEFFLVFIFRFDSIAFENYPAAFGHFVGCE